MPEKIKAVCAVVGEKAKEIEFTEVRDDAFNKICGYNFECHGYCGEEGMYEIYCPLNGNDVTQEFNRQLFGTNYYGNIIVCKMDKDTSSLEPDELNYLIEQLNSPKALMELSSQEEMKMGGM